MSYGRETIANGLRKAGQTIRNFDDAYSEKIMDMYSQDNTNPVVGSIGLLVGGSVPSTRKLDTTPQDDSWQQKTMATAMSYGLPAVSTVPKYVLPAAGVTLAGKGLVDLAGILGQQTNGTLEP
jgi:hypothetical protein